MWNCKIGKDADEHRQIILQKAQMLFLEHGVDQVSMHQIAKSAEIGQGTLYRRYAHKGELCLDILQESYLKVCNEVLTYLETSQASPVRERLVNLFRMMIDFLEEKSSFLEAIQAPTYEGRCSILFQTPLYQSFHSAICGLLAEAYPENAKEITKPKEDKETDSLPNPTFMTYAILAAMAPDLYLHLRRNCGYSPEDICLNLQKVFLDTVQL